MSSNVFIQTTSVTVDAVLARIRMPAESVAALSPGDRLDIEAQGGAGLLVRLIAEGQTIAVAALEVVDGQLIATILNNDGNNGPGVAGRRIDQWKHKKAKTTA
jgi:flagellar motor switch/type III secretory pathway protein FliN